MICLVRRSSILMTINTRPLTRPRILGVSFFTLLSLLAFAGALRFKDTVAIKSPVSVESGLCAPCFYEDIWIDREVRTRRYVSLPATNRYRERIVRILSRRVSRADQEIIFRSIATLTKAKNGNTVRKNYSTISINQCIRSRNFRCNELIQFDYLEKTKILIVFDEILHSGNLPNGNFSREIMVPHGLWAPRLGVRLRANRTVYVDGDIEPSLEGGWHFGKIEKGYLAFSTLANWSDLAESYQISERKALSRGSELLPNVNEQPISAQKALNYSWVWMRRNIQYQDVSLLYSAGDSPASLEQILQTRVADCKGMGLLLGALLKKAGVDAQTVLVDKRLGASRVATILPMNRFTHVIVYIPALHRYIDPTIASITPVPTGGLREYSFSLNSVTGQIQGISNEQVR